MARKIKENDNVSIFGWMVRDLRLTGNALLLYALIYDRTVNGPGYVSSMTHFREYTGMEDKNIKILLNKLFMKRLINREKVLNEEGYPANEYSVNMQTILEKQAKRQNNG